MTTHAAIVHEIVALQQSPCNCGTPCGAILRSDTTSLWHGQLPVRQQTSGADKTNDCLSQMVGIGLDLNNARNLQMASCARRRRTPRNARATDGWFGMGSSAML